MPYRSLRPHRWSGLYSWMLWWRQRFLYDRTWSGRSDLVLWWVLYGCSKAWLLVSCREEFLHWASHRWRTLRILPNVHLSKKFIFKYKLRDVFEHIVLFCFVLVALVTHLGFSHSRILALSHSCILGFSRSQILAFLDLSMRLHCSLKQFSITLTYLLFGVCLIVWYLFLYCHSCNNVRIYICVYQIWHNKKYKNDTECETVRWVISATVLCFEMSLNTFT